LISVDRKEAKPVSNLDNFAGMIYLIVGDLDIPANIPSHLRTL
jgi:hypothetical protein